jgi:hypothetical protein
MWKENVRSAIESECSRLWMASVGRIIQSSSLGSAITVPIPSIEKTASILATFLGVTFYIPSIRGNQADT